MRIRVECSFLRGVIDVQQRLPKLVGIVSSQLSASAQEMPKAENHGAVAFLDIPPGSRRIRARRQLHQVATVGDSPTLCLPAPGNKSGGVPALSQSRNPSRLDRRRFWPPDMIFRSILSTSSLQGSDSWGLAVNPLSRESFRIREARKSPRRERFTSSAGINV
jgi:hypothetical protein